MLDNKSRTFIRALLDTTVERVRVVPAGSRFWRACLDYDTGIDNVFLPCKKERLTPFRDKAREGRVNPKGIPCLYLADDPTTAIMEIRPWIGSLVTVAKVTTNQTLTLVDFAVDVEFSGCGATFLGQLIGKELEEFVWSSVNDAFAAPVDRDENKADYAPTQHIAEALRSEGHDGILFKSSLGAGRNVALFDVDAVDLVSREIRRVAKIDLEHSAIGDRIIEANYWQEEHTDNPADTCVTPEPFSSNKAPR